MVQRGQRETEVGICELRGQDWSRDEKNPKKSAGSKVFSSLESYQSLCVCVLVCMCMWEYTCTCVHVVMYMGICVWGEYMCMHVC